MPFRYVIVVRHGERADDKPPRSGSANRVDGDPPLTADGVRAVAKVAAQIKQQLEGKCDVANCAVFSSPFARCRQTAEALHRGIGSLRPVVVDNELSEVYGPVRIHTDSAPTLQSAAHSVGKLPEWGETIPQARGRYAQTFWRYAAHADFPSCVALVTHGDGVEAIFQNFYVDRVVFEVGYLAYLIVRASSEGDAEVVHTHLIQWIDESKTAPQPSAPPPSGRAAPEAHNDGKSEANGEGRDAQHELEKLQKEYDLVVQSGKAVSGELGELRMQKHLLDGKFSETECELANTKQKLEAAQSEKRGLEESVEHYRKSGEAALALAEERQARITALEARTSLLQARVEALESQGQNLETRLAEGKATIRALELAMAERECTAATSQEQAQRKHKDEVKALYDSLQEVQQNVTKLETTVAESKRANESLMASNEKLLKKVEDLDGELREKNELIASHVERKPSGSRLSGSMKGSPQGQKPVPAVPATVSQLHRTGAAGASRTAAGSTAASKLRPDRTVPLRSALKPAAAAAPRRTTTTATVTAVPTRPAVHHDPAPSKPAASRATTKPILRTSPGAAAKPSRP